MRLLLALMISPIFSFGQIAPSIMDLKAVPYAREASKIMDLLHIPKRKNVDLNIPLHVMVNYSWTQDKYKQMYSQYSNGVIYITSWVDSVFRNYPKFQHPFYKAIAEGILVHESVHHLELYKDSSGSNAFGEIPDAKKYRLTGLEKNAWPAGSYYIVKKWNPELAKSTMRQKKPLEWKKERMIDLYDSIMHDKIYVTRNLD
jgi:hypothetical protein